jgi:hypothetical protein
MKDRLFELIGKKQAGEIAPLELIEVNKLPKRFTGTFYNESIQEALNKNPDGQYELPVTPSFNEKREMLTHFLLIALSTDGVNWTDDRITVTSVWATNSTNIAEIYAL